MIDVELETFTSIWKDCKYMAGQSCPSVGVDCVRLVVAWLKRARDLYQYDLPHRCQDAAFHDARVVVECRRELQKVFSMKECDPKDVLPGGIIAVSRKSNPFHVGIVLPGAKQVLHAEKRQSSVRVTSLQALNCDGFVVREAYNL